MARRWIQAAIKRPGALKKELGVPESKNIGTTRLAKAKSVLEKKRAKGEKLSRAESLRLRRINLAQTLRRLHRARARAGQ